MDNWERDRQLRAELSAIEVTKGIGPEWHEQRERLIEFQSSTGFPGRAFAGPRDKVYNNSMETHRVDGIKYNFDRLTTEELENIHGHLLARHELIVGDIELVESALFARRNDQLPLEELGGVALGGQVEIG